MTCPPGAAPLGLCRTGRSSQGPTNTSARPLFFESGSLASWISAVASDAVAEFTGPRCALLGATCQGAPQDWPNQPARCKGDAPPRPVTFRHLRAPLVLAGVAGLLLLDATTRGAPSKPPPGCLACGGHVSRRSPGEPSWCAACWLKTPLRLRENWRAAYIRRKARMRANAGPALRGVKVAEQKILAALQVKK